MGRKKSKDPNAEVKKRKDAMDTHVGDVAPYPLEKPKYLKRTQPKPTTPDPKTGSGLKVVIGVHKLTNDNIGFVLSRLRFYQFDARNYDNPGKYPFKIYETSWELGNVVKSKIAEFATKQESDEAYNKIRDAYAKDFRERYTLTEASPPAPLPVDSGWPSALHSDRPVTHDPVFDGVPSTGVQQEVPRGPEEPA